MKNDLPPTCFFEKALTINCKSTLPGVLFTSCSKQHLGSYDDLNLKMGQNLCGKGQIQHIIMLPYIKTSKLELYNFICN